MFCHGRHTRRESRHWEREWRRESRRWQRDVRRWVGMGRAYMHNESQHRATHDGSEGPPDLRNDFPDQAAHDDFEEPSEKHETRRSRRQRREERGNRMRYGHDENRTLYRSREGMIFGVCRGLAEHYSFSVSWMRIIVLAASTATGFWPTVGLYIVAALIMKLEPVLPLENEEDKEFYHSYADSRSMALHRLKRTYDNLDRRIQRLENTVTTREYDWDERLQH